MSRRHQAGRSPGPALGLVGLLTVVGILWWAVQRGDANAPSSPGSRSTAKPPSLSGELRPTGETQAAQRIYVIDGDTIDVAIDGQRQRVRYIGIDAPEVGHPDATGQPHGEDATIENARLLATGALILERELTEHDRFGRLLRHVWVRDRHGRYTFIGLELVREGLAEALVIPPEVEHAGVLRDAEGEAMQAHLGIWGN